MRTVRTLSSARAFHSQSLPCGVSRSADRGIDCARAMHSCAAGACAPWAAWESSGAGCCPMRVAASARADTPSSLPRARHHRRAVDVIAVCVGRSLRLCGSDRQLNSTFGFGWTCRPPLRCRHLWCSSRLCEVCAQTRTQAPSGALPIHREDGETGLLGPPTTPLSCDWPDP